MFSNDDNLPFHNGSRNSRGDWGRWRYEQIVNNGASLQTNMIVHLRNLSGVFLPFFLFLSLLAILFLFAVFSQSTENPHHVNNDTADTNIKSDTIINKGNHQYYPPTHNSIINASIFNTTDGTNATNDGNIVRIIGTDEGEDPSHNTGEKKNIYIIYRT